jgi:hypothetical protein
MMSHHMYMLYIDDTNKINVYTHTHEPLALI